MADPAEELTLSQRLGQALDRGQLPAGGAAEAAERLIDRLARPARLALLGLPGAGKSAVLNLLAGETVIDESLRLPTVMVRFGSPEQMVCTLPDGSTQVVPGRDLNDIVPMTPALVTMELHLPALSVISLLEVAAGPAEGDQRRATTWASKRADIMVWVSTSFLPKEQMVWESLPETIRDNGFLLLSKTDLMGGRDAVSGMVDRVEMRAGEEFRQILPVSVLTARKAMQAPGGIDRVMFRDSGASAVILAIKSRVEMARRADMDMGELLLARHPEGAAPSARRLSNPLVTISEPPLASPATPLLLRLPDIAVDPAPGESDQVPDPQSAAPAAPGAMPDLSSSSAPRRYAERLRQMPPPYEPPVYQPPAPPRRTLGREPLLPPASESAPTPAPDGNRLRGIFARSDDELSETTPETAALKPLDDPQNDPVSRSAPKPVPMKDPLRGIFARTAEELQEATDQAATLDPLHGSDAEPVPNVEPSQPGAIARPAAPGPAQRPAVTMPPMPRPVSMEPRPDRPRGSERRERPRIAARASVTVTPPAAVAAFADRDREILETAIHLIMQRAGELADRLRGVDKIPVDLVLDHGREVTERVADLLAESERPEVRRIAADLGEVQDLIMLMQLEKGHAPADDTVTLLLQLRRDLETLMAA